MEPSTRSRERAVADPPLRASPTVEIERSTEALDREWDDLADRVGAAPFLRPGWIRAWWRAFGSGDPGVLTVRRSGRLAAALPLEIRRGVVRSPTNWHTPFFGVL